MSDQSAVFIGVSESDAAEREADSRAERARQEAEIALQGAISGGKQPDPWRFEAGLQSMSPQDDLTEVFAIEPTEPEPEPAHLKQPAPRIVIRVTPEGHDWASGLADHCSLTLTDLVWQSLMRQADACGYHYRIPQRYRHSNPTRARRRPLDPI